MNDFISLRCVLDKIDGSFGISPLSYDAWPSHNTCFFRGPRDVCATGTPFYPACNDSETILVLIDKTGKATYKIFCAGDFTHTTAPLSLSIVSLDQKKKTCWIAFCH